MARPLRVFQDEYCYHVTTRTNSGHFRFRKKKRHVRIFFEVLNEAKQKYGVIIRDVVLMDTHYHVVIQTVGQNLGRVMQYINGQTARRLNLLDGVRGHLYEARYCCTVLDTDSGLVRCLRYVYRNPLRAGMVRTLEEYEESSFSYYAFGRTMDVSMTPHGVYLDWGKTPHERQGYFQCLITRSLTQEEEEETRLCLKRRFFGTRDFIARMEEKWRRDPVTSRT